MPVLSDSQDHGPTFTTGVVACLWLFEGGCAPGTAPPETVGGNRVEGRFRRPHCQAVMIPFRSIRCGSVNGLASAFTMRRRRHTPANSVNCSHDCNQKRAPPALRPKKASTRPTALSSHTSPLNDEDGSSSTGLRYGSPSPCQRTPALMRYARRLVTRRCRASVTRHQTRDLTGATAPSSRPSWARTTDQSGG